MNEDDINQLNKELDKNKIDREICEMELEKFKKEYIENIKFNEGKHIIEYLKNNGSQTVKIKKPFCVRIKDFYNKIINIFYSEY